MGRYTIVLDSNAELMRRLKKINICVINNSEHVTDLLKKLLNEVGFTSLHIYNNAFNAIQHLKKHKMHMLIIDSALTVPTKNNIMDNKMIDANDTQSV
ncbi:MAG: hypothetical protein AB7F82_09075, partial [Alphaproteobacteria bacterium]